MRAVSHCNILKAGLTVLLGLGLSGCESNLLNLFAKSTIESYIFEDQSADLNETLGPDSNHDSDDSEDKTSAFVSSGPSVILSSH